ncbi:hypothetical protein DICPUDRAFT_82355 [Dictyostelium purpureum]|uniref:Glutathione S-transferase n=1 Tax=Dictyostelium purpureum TaxID=5786 RepID=F0ZWA2_DICPU|nr:uncharacterized protein DICPUDRAFT_82355 [Dictyostelium purpureum]EGC31773.1 hypothetical protein DICPUDRAFT_82355 [Dictyostelium purpureum]|eukprot:XP_003291696.1 hypothetical protein DICPUDRAFT_82355 [Dictyostelium purpureum]
MSVPKVYYYPVRGRGQFVVALLHYLKVDFEIDTTSNEQIKPETTFGQVPYYVDDEIKLAQTHAIARYLANKHKIHGKSLVEQAKVDEIVDSVWDTLNPLLAATFGGNDSAKEEYKKNNKLHLFLDVYEKKLNENKYIAGGDDYTLADFDAFLVYNYIDLLGYLTDRNSYPKLEELRKYFTSLPQLQKYFESVKNTPL